jgi:hypothetical protein
MINKEGMMKIATAQVMWPSKRLVVGKWEIIIPNIRRPHRR